MGPCLRLKREASCSGDEVEVVGDCLGDAVGAECADDLSAREEVHEGREASVQEGFGLLYRGGKMDEILVLGDSQILDTFGG